MGNEGVGFIYGRGTVRLSRITTLNLPLTLKTVPKKAKDGDVMSLIYKKSSYFVTPYSHEIVQKYPVDDILYDNNSMLEQSSLLTVTIRFTLLIS